LIQNIFRGLVSGFFATLVLTLLLSTKGFIPQLDTITTLDGIFRAFLNTLGERAPPAPLGGWLWHFVIGTLWWGMLYAIMEPILPGRRPWTKGMSFGFGAALFILLLVMPLAGAGFFGMHLNALQPLVTIGEHLIYGSVLGSIYGWSHKQSPG
jgi:Na+-transporting NADH:ubiquinone oxidoreductase subunit NqrB